jgi:hypothetical protein
VGKTTKTARKTRRNTLETQDPSRRHANTDSFFPHAWVRSFETNDQIYISIAEEEKGRSKGPNGSF